MRKAPGTLVAAVTLLAGCDGGAEPQPLFTSTDSAGVEVALSQEPRWGTVSMTEVSLQFGETSGPEHLLFDRISGVTRLPTGAIAVGNQGDNTIRLFDDSGAVLDELGGTGRGPGEFALLRGVQRCGAEVITTFEYNWRQLLFDLEGDFLESRMLQFPDDRFGVYTLACGPDGRIVGTGWGDAGLLEHEIGMYRSEAGLYVGDGGAGPFQQIGTTVVADRIRWGEMEAPHPIGRKIVIAVTEDGFITGTADDYSLAWHTMAGDTTRIVRWNGPARPLEPEHVSRYLEWRLNDAPDEEHPALRREVAEYEMPDSLPAYGAIHRSPNGVVWVQPFSAEWWPEARWWGFLPSGEWAWEIVFGSGFAVTEFGDDEVLGVTTDQLGIERVRGYRLDLPRT